MHKNTRMLNETLFKRTNPLRLWCTILNNLHHICVDKHNDAPQLHVILPIITGWDPLILKEWLVFTILFIKEHFIYRDFEQPGNPEREFK